MDDEDVEDVEDEEEEGLESNVNVAWYGFVVARKVLKRNEVGRRQGL